MKLHKTKKILQSRVLEQRKSSCGQFSTKQLDKKSIIRKMTKAKKIDEELQHHFETIGFWEFLFIFVKKTNTLNYAQQKVPTQNFCTNKANLIIHRHEKNNCFVLR